MEVEQQQQLMEYNDGVLSNVTTTTAAIQQSQEGGVLMMSIADNRNINNVTAAVTASSSNAHITLAESCTMITAPSLHKLFLIATTTLFLAYAAVSPRTLPPVEYNAAFKSNINLVLLLYIAPVAYLFSVFDARLKLNDVNAIIHVFYRSFLFGYIAVFVLETLLATALRLMVFAVWEPAVFKLTPRIPLPVLPWVLRSESYRPKRITLFAADFAVSCIAAPIVEEVVKLKIVQWYGNLPQNYQSRVVRRPSKRDPKKIRVKRILEPIHVEYDSSINASIKTNMEEEVTDINAHVTTMLACSLGLKLADSTRRILMYTKRNHSHKAFYSICRGIFPIHELCGCMTALQLARRDILGVKIPAWKMILGAVFVHAMANFRGMKPVYKWNSATPWSEMQLSPWSVADDSTLVQMVNKGLAKLMWLIILGRVFGYCVKNYYRIGRQARKRATTYAGKRAAFLSQLAADDMLKKSKKDQSKH